ncbi:ABC transporter substrate-binding protein [Nitrosopumilus sp. b3]|uniref:metal ABC transporter substrate-binding protein n=1 Tax=Nitrosopumilus sp. b3 TaxID=2109909 RepID=UPI0015F62FD3|nr:zinc ABC transporter substrate-binding protein [Nitrosopumilus sp. b3]KAF6246243.1 ABC transporter substrate-binding protein [Nitrosopumilus sp. b3]
MKQTKVATILIIIVIPLISFYVMNDSEENFTVPTEKTKLQVLTSFYPLYEFTKMIGGDKVDVEVLVPPGIEPHDWEPTIKDIQKMNQVDFVVINGLGFEEWVRDLSNFKNLSIVDSSVGIKPIIKTESKSQTISYDPHIWLNPNSMKKQVQNITAELIKRDPQNLQFYKKNSESYLQKINVIDTKIKDRLEECTKRDFIAFHDAFTYFAKDYELNQYTVLKSSDPIMEPTIQDIEEVINLAKNLDIKIIFTEEYVNPKMSQIIADEINGKVLILSPLEIQDKEKTYLERFEENFKNLELVLCT